MVFFVSSDKLHTLTSKIGILIYGYNGLSADEFGAPMKLDK